MASPSPKKQETSSKEDVGCGGNSTTTPYSANLVLENCLNLNQTTTNDNEKCHKGEAKKRSFDETEITDEDDDEEKKKKKNNLDLNLRLTPLGLHPKPDHHSSTSSQLIKTPEISSTTSSSTCMMLPNLDSSSSTTEEVELISNTTTSDQPLQVADSSPAPPSPPTVSLILMGCSRCIMYVMVSEANPECPKCHSSNLIDMFRSPLSGKKSKKF